MNFQTYLTLYPTIKLKQAEAAQEILSRFNSSEWIAIVQNLSQSAVFHHRAPWLRMQPHNYLLEASLQAIHAMTTEEVSAWNEGYATGVVPDAKCPYEENTQLAGYWYGGRGAEVIDWDKDTHG